MTWERSLFFSLGRLGLAFCLVFLGGASSKGGPTGNEGARPIDFNRDIRSILSANCVLANVLLAAELQPNSVADYDPDPRRMRSSWTSSWWIRVSANEIEEKIEELMSGLVC